MAEHWKSTPKYWCKHCSIYVKDTNFERKQHESTGKHQGNLKRFLQGIQKDHQLNEREKEKTKAEVERLNRITGGAPSNSQSSAITTPSLKSTKSASTNLSAADQKRQWAQLAEMGIAVPEHARAEMAMAGDWQTIAKKPEVEAPEQSLDDKLNVGVRKRKFEGDDDVENLEETIARKGWGAKLKRYPGKDDRSDDDLDALLAQPIATQALKPAQERTVSKAEDTDTSVKREEVLETSDQVADEDSRKSRGTTSNLLTPHSEVKTESSESNLGSIIDEPKPVFKKRKPKQSAP